MITDDFLPEILDPRALNTTHEQRVKYLSKQINGVNPTTEPEKFHVWWDLFLLSLDHDDRQKRESGG